MRRLSSSVKSLSIPGSNTIARTAKEKDNPLTRIFLEVAATLYQVHPSPLSPSSAMPCGALCHDCLEWPISYKYLFHYFSCGHINTWTLELPKEYGELRYFYSATEIHFKYKNMRLICKSLDCGKDHGTWKKLCPDCSKNGEGRRHMKDISYEEWICWGCGDHGSMVSCAV